MLEFGTKAPVQTGIDLKIRILGSGSPIVVWDAKRKERMREERIDVVAIYKSTDPAAMRFPDIAARQLQYILRHSQTPEKLEKLLPAKMLFTAEHFLQHLLQTGDIYSTLKHAHTKYTEAMQYFHKINE